MKNKYTIDCILANWFLHLLVLLLSTAMFMTSQPFPAVFATIVMVGVDCLVVFADYHNIVDIQPHDQYYNNKS